MTTYPESIKEWLADTESILEDFFGDHTIFSNRDVARETYQDVAGRHALQSWIDTGDIQVSDEELAAILNQVVVKSAIKILQEKGMIDSVEDADGEMIYWPTEKGIDLLKDFPENPEENESSIS
jgi:predicted transcriptional regulator